MFEKLIKAWDDYQEVIKREISKPIGSYDPIATQSFGGGFATRFRTQKEAICLAIGWPEENFNYGVKHEIMNKIKSL